MDLASQSEDLRNNIENSRLAEELDIDINELQLAQNFFKGLQTPPTRDEMKSLLTHYSVARNQEKHGSPGVSIPYALETSLRNTFFLENTKNESGSSSLGTSMRPADNTSKIESKNASRQNSSISLNLATRYEVQLNRNSFDRFVRDYFNNLGLNTHMSKSEIDSIPIVNTYIEQGETVEGAFKSVIELILLEMHWKKVLIII